MKKKNNKNIGVVIIAKNEEENILDCLKSVEWVDEIVVVDGGSTDRTGEISKRFGASVFSCFGDDFSQRRNLGTRKVKSYWVLHIDADERVTRKLREEILDIVKNDGYGNTHFAIPRRNYVFDKQMKHCGLWPDYVVRFFKKKDFVGWSGKLHEQPTVKGRLGYMNNYFVHIKHNNLFDIVKKTNSWSKIEAELMFNAGHPPMNIPRFLTAIFREFWLRFVKQGAFLDGVEGVIYGIYQIYSRFLSYAKLWEMQLK